MRQHNLATAALLAACGAAPAQVVISEVAVSGQPAPGTGPGITFFSSSEQSLVTLPRITADGRVVFFATLTGATQAVDDQGVWSRPAGGPLRLVARRGQEAPGTPEGTHFMGFPLFPPLVPVLAGANVSGFLAGLSGPGVIHGQTVGTAGVYLDDGVVLSLLARHGDPAPGLPGIAFDRADHANPLRLPLISAHGRALLGAFLFGPGVTSDNDESIWTNRTGPLTLVVREGDPAPGTNGVFGPSPESFSPGGLRGFSFSPSSRVVIFGNIRGNGIDFQNDDGVWAEAPAGGLALVAREGQPAPGHPGATFGQGVSDAFGTPTMNAAGAVMFNANITGDLNTTAGVFSTRSGVLASEGRTFEGQLPGERTFPSRASLAASGAIAIQEGLLPAGQSSGTDSGVWSDLEGAMRLIARTGQPVPDDPNGAVFASFQPIGRFFLVIGNDSIGFIATVAGPGVSAANDLGFFQFVQGAGIRTVIRRGDQLQIGGQTRTVADLLAGGMNASGEAVLKLGFTDNTFAIVTTRHASTCYPNCDQSTAPPVLNVADFGCFLTRYAAGEAYANCDESTQAPVLNVADFGCFLTKYAAACR